jgi:hypothetical protein
MKKSTKTYIAAAAAAVAAAGTAVALLNSGRKFKWSKSLSKPCSKEKLTFIKEKLENHKSRVEKHLEKINSRLAEYETHPSNI